MNCETIDAIIDDHLVARLGAAERQRAAEHVSGCARCSAAWGADDALRGETIADPAPELFPALLRRIAAPPARRETAVRGRWPALLGAAAAIAVVAIAARWALVEPEATPPQPAVSPAPSPTPAAARFVAGRDYEVLPGAAARAGALAAAGEVEVTEFFMYLCFPCYAVEPDLARWEAQAPSHVTLTRVPALFNPQAELHARAYYTAEALGKLDAMHAAFYDEIHARGNPLASRAALAELFQRFGVDDATFDSAFDSSDVDARVQRAVALNREYGIRVTPSLVVAGRYSTNPGLMGSGQAMLEVVDELVAASAPCQSRCADDVRER